MFDLGFFVVTMRGKMEAVMVGLGEVDEVLKKRFCGMGFFS